MRAVRREEILDFVTWGERRALELPEILAVRERRRVQVAGVLTYLFENRDTVRFQVQEMVRVERMVRESDIAHELATYNELLGAPGELGCTLLIEIEDRAERALKLAAWVKLPEHLYLALEDGRRIRAKVDERQRDDQKLSSVQFLRFPVEGRVPVAAGVDFPGLIAETPLSDDLRRALKEDLDS